MIGHSLHTHPARETFVDSLDARAKLLGAVLFLAALVTTPSDAVWNYFYFAAAVFMTLAASRVPIGATLKRSAIVAPLLLVILLAGLIPLTPALSQGDGHPRLQHLWAIGWKAWLGILVALWLSAVTPFPELLEGLARLRMPSMLVLLTGFIYRHFFVLAGEVVRMRRAMQARGFRLYRAAQARDMGHLAGTLFLRSHERAERSYQAMLARGYLGRVTRPERRRLAKSDLAFMLAVFALVLVLRSLPG